MAWIFEDITNQQLFGRKGLMYAHWLQASEATDRLLILVGDRLTDLAGQGVDAVGGKIGATYDTFEYRDQKLLALEVWVAHVRAIMKAAGKEKPYLSVVLRD